MKSTLLISILLFAFSASSKDLEHMTCVQAGSQDTGLKKISLVTQPSGKMRARVSVAAGNSPTETYSYIVRLLPPSHRAGNAMIYRAALGRFELSICRTCTPLGKNGLASTVNVKVPKKAKLHAPSSQLSFNHISCTLL